VRLRQSSRALCEMFCALSLRMDMMLYFFSEFCDIPILRLYLANPPPQHRHLSWHHANHTWSRTRTRRSRL
jgi:hypothetical protein